ncbi:MAG: sensor histidine kinase [Hydrocarboniphaga sp.]|uniref:sensor histidine kinase n=1 Tax=Hydrocarboniphaga sp. TaxID=2033016 RepID=UPI00260966C7|nr:sensor histidine kinase [Hydrocarboniphaga sp.]MDB5972276.1 sensor histidine kinase [Hydrocarboniphaga sp.]
MSTIAPPPTPQGLARALSWRRLRVAIGSAALLGFVTSPAFTEVATVEVMARTASVGLASLLAFGLFERRPARLPTWLARWVLQVIGVALVIPFAALAVTLVVTHRDTIPLWQNKDRLAGMAMLIVIGLLTAPWITVAALFRQRDFAARSQALAFDLERSELERQALDSRLRLLQAQVEPHFLFNTLANVRELVDSGSPQASQVLSHLIAYLRAAVPRLHEPATTLGQELQLVRAYLELMHMRMPDRLQFALQADE